MIDDIEELLLTQQWLLVVQKSAAADRYFTSYEVFCKKSVRDTSKNMVIRGPKPFPVLPKNTHALRSWGFVNPAGVTPIWCRWKFWKGSVELWKGSVAQVVTILGRVLSIESWLFNDWIIVFMVYEIINTHLAHLI